MSTEYQGRTPDQIIRNEIRDHSSWHFFQALSWLDYAKRSRLPSAIHYTAFELRYGVEYLLFQLLVLKNKFLTDAEYKLCIGDPNKMKQMLSKQGPNYARLAEFTQLLLSLQPELPKLQFWDLNELMKYWGIASEFLHFVGAQALTYKDEAWLIKAIVRLESPLSIIWDKVTTKVGFGFISVEGMEPEVYEAWLQYSSQSLSKEDLERRMRLIQPALAIRRRQR